MTTQNHPRTPLRRAREARGLRLEDVASASGISIRAAFDAERGRHKPHPSTKKLIAQALGMDAGELWPPDGEMASRSPPRRAPNHGMTLGFQHSVTR